MKKKNLMDLLTIIMVAMLSVGLASCSNDDENSDSNGIIGTWIHKCDGSNDGSEGPHIITLNFKSNGTVYFSEEYTQFPQYNWIDEGEYRTTETTLWIRWEEDIKEGKSWYDVWSCEYKIMDDGKTLWTDEGVVYTRK